MTTEEREAATAWLEDAVKDDHIAGPPYQTLQSALFVVRLWIVPVLAVYGFGLGLAWVRRGFRVESK